MSEERSSAAERSGPDVSVVIPLHDEVEVLEELVGRCRRALETTGWPYELILVNDHSTDGTRESLDALAADGVVMPIHLERNLGQIGATRAGLARCRGSRVVVLDGDLQDPPESIATLVAEHDKNSGWEDVIFCVKASRDDPLWFRLGRGLFGLVGRLGKRLPAGAGSFVLMRRELALRVARAPMTHLNLASVLCVLADRVGSVFYDKGARAHGASRVGAVGLFREAVGSAMITGALERALLLLALLVPGAVLVGADTGVVVCGAGCLGFTWGLWCVSLGGSLWAGIRRRRLLVLLRSPEVSPPTE